MISRNCYNNQHVLMMVDLSRSFQTSCVISFLLISKNPSNISETSDVTLKKISFHGLNTPYPTPHGTVQLKGTYGGARQASSPRAAQKLALCFTFTQGKGSHA
jgi:hypothetical protein